MLNVFIVTGETGDYDEHRTWSVCAYLHEENAKKRVEELNALLASFGVHADQEEEMNMSNYTHDEKIAALLAKDGVTAKIEAAIRNHERGDKRFELDYTGARYDYEAVELVNERPMYHVPPMKIIDNR